MHDSPHQCDVKTEKGILLLSFILITGYWYGEQENLTLVQKTYVYVCVPTKYPLDAVLDPH